MKSTICLFITVYVLLNWISFILFESVLYVLSFIDDKIFLTLTDAKGEKLFISTHAEDRPDVAAAFKHPNLSGSGYKALIDLSTLNGAYVLGMAGIHNSVLFDCSQFKIPVTFSQ